MQVIEAVINRLEIELQWQCLWLVIHLIFDMNSLLLNTERLHSVVFEEKPGHYSKKHSWQMKSLVLGRKVLEASQIITDILQLPMFKEKLVEESPRKLKELFPIAAFMPDLEKWIPHLQKFSILFEVDISSGTVYFEMKTNRHKEFFSLSDDSILGGDPKAKIGKPDPDFFLSYTRMFALPHPMEKCLVLDDAPHRVEAAIAAGMQVGMIPDGNLSQDLTRKAILVLSSLQDFQSELFPTREGTMLR
nr:LOW QUALITY PROTEIN: pseudouridine-5'-phosphatase [Oryctolagus cuniculus]